MKHLLILISILLLSSPLIGQTKETSVLYKWKSGSRWVWKSFEWMVYKQNTWVKSKMENLMVGVLN